MYIWLWRILGLIFVLLYAVSLSRCSEPKPIVQELKLPPNGLAEFRARMAAYSKTDNEFREALERIENTKF